MHVVLTVPMLAGKYRDLDRRVLHLTLVEQTRFGNLVEISSSELTLLDLASGSVQQEVTFAERDGRTTIDAYRLNFHVHFQARPPHHCHPSLTAHVMSQLYGMNRRSSPSRCDWSIGQVPTCAPQTRPDHRIPSSSFTFGVRRANGSATGMSRCNPCICIYQ